MKPVDHKEFIKNLKNGDEESFRLLYNTYGSKIYNLAYRMLGNKEDAEDITQETFMQAYRNIESFKEHSQLYTWIYTIAKNLCYRALQHKRRNSFASLETLIYTARSQEVPEDLAEWEKQSLLSQIKEGCLTGLLRCLSFYQRAAFIFHVLLELPVKEVAEIIEKSEGATKVLVHRARQNLKGFLCKHCSLYNPENPCRCESLMEFSLKQGWITKPSGKEAETWSTGMIEAELERIRTVTDLYKSLSEQRPTEELDTQIQHIIKSQDWTIFSTQKV